MAEIILTPKESEDFFYSALCNTFGTGYMTGYGLLMDYKNEEYKKAKQDLVKEGNSDDICSEDVLMKILQNGGTLTFLDEENDGEYTRSITLKDVHERVKKMPIEHLVDYIKENDDVVTGDLLLQTVFFEGVIFG